MSRQCETRAWRQEGLGPEGVEGAEGALQPFKKRQTSIGSNPLDLVTWGEGTPKQNLITYWLTSFGLSPVRVLQRSICLLT